MWNTCLWLRLPSPDGPIPYTPIPPSFGVVVGWDALLGQPASSKRVDVPLISSSRFSTCDRELPREQAVVLEGFFLLALCDHFSSKSKSCSVTKIKLYLKKTQNNQPPPPSANVMAPLSCLKKNWSLDELQGAAGLSTYSYRPGVWTCRLVTRDGYIQAGSLHHHKTVFLVLDTSFCFWFLGTVIQNL